MSTKALLAGTFAALAAALPANLTLETRTDAPYGIKKGLCYNDGNAINALSRPGSATWAYNWGAALDHGKFQGIPMCWGPHCDPNPIMNKINGGDTPWVLGYNEPDMTNEHGGCRATPQQAYDAWGNDMFKFKDRGAKLVCPAISSWNTNSGDYGGPSGLTWLRQFARYKNNPSEFRCDAQALHWYGVDGKSGRDQGQLFIDYIAYAHGEVNSIFGREMDLWITEFAPLPLNNENVMADFLDYVIPWLNAQAWVARYAPFKAEYLLNGSNLNRAGSVFVNKT